MIIILKNSKEEEETISFESIYIKIIEAYEEEEGLKIQNKKF